MRQENLDAYYLPFLNEYKGEVKFETLEFKSADLALSLKYPVLDGSLLEFITSRLRINREKYLFNQSIYRIIDICAEVTARWRNPDYHLRKVALQYLPGITGFSREMVALIMDKIMCALDKEALLDMVKSEIDQPEYLDSYIPRYKANIRSKAFGPALTVNIFSGNIPVLPTLSVLCTILVKSGLIGKASSKEPLFTVLLAKTFEEVDPELAQCLAMVIWSGGDKLIETALFAAVDCVVLYGTNKSIKQIREQIAPGKRFIYFGHRVSFGYIGRERLTAASIQALVKKVALDIICFDQYACMSPHIYYLERGGEITPRHFCEYLGKALDELGTLYPPGEKNLHSSAEIQNIRALYEIKELSEDTIGLLCSEKSTAWTIIYEENKNFELSILNRVIRIKPVAGFQDLIPELQPLESYLQTVGIALDEKRALELAEILGKRGVSRLAQVGNMTRGAGTWRHDGRYNLLDMLKWVDWELD